MANKDRHVPSARLLYTIYMLETPPHLFAPGIRGTSTEYLCHEGETMVRPAQVMVHLIVGAIPASAQIICSCHQLRTIVWAFTLKIACRPELEQKGCKRSIVARTDAVVAQTQKLHVVAQVYLNQ